MPYVLGLDVGSSYIKGVLVDDKANEYKYEEKSGRNYRTTAENVRAALVDMAHAENDTCLKIIATGSGSECVRFADSTQSEMLCLIRAIKEKGYTDCVIMDMGGSSCRLGVMDEDGRLESFDFSDRCASGSGTVLESITRVLHIPFNELTDLSARATKPTVFTSSCAVFAESEAITAVARGESVQNIVAGFHKSIATKFSAMVSKHIASGKMIIATGGMSMDTGVLSALETMQPFKLTKACNPQFCIARGAALLALDQI